MIGLIIGYLIWLVGILVLYFLGFDVASLGVGALLACFSLLVAIGVNLRAQREGKC